MLTTSRKWRRGGTLERIHTVLWEELRIAFGRDPQPSAVAMLSARSFSPLQRAAHLKRYFPDFLDDFVYQAGFNVISRRWVVERTISWLGRARRLSKD